MPPGNERRGGKTRQIDFQSEVFDIGESVNVIKRWRQSDQLGCEHGFYTFEIADYDLKILEQWKDAAIDNGAAAEDLQHEVKAARAALTSIRTAADETLTLLETT